MDPQVSNPNVLYKSELNVVIPLWKVRAASDRDMAETYPLGMQARNVLANAKYT
jgi:hypothetical protein